MAAEPWSERDDAIFEEYAFFLSDNIPNKWERIAAMLHRPATVDELRQRYANIFRDLWLIERGEVTRASYTAAREAEAAAAAAGAAAGGGPAQPALQQRQGRWSEEEIRVVADHARANGGEIRQGQFDALLQQLPGQSVASLREYLKRNSSQEDNVTG